MTRHLIQLPAGRAWGCSNCEWEFIAEGPPRGDTMAAMAEHYTKARDVEFAKHDCRKYPKHK